MSRATMAAHFLLFSALISLTGCFSPSPGGRYLPETARGARPALPGAAQPAAAELRIPASAVAVAPAGSADIPLVPVPPVPVGNGTPPPTSQPATPAIVPVSARTPAPLPAAGSTVRQLQQQAAAAYSGIDSYIARLTRREQINGKSEPEEVMLFKFRKQPWSVYFKWLGETGKGREVIFVKGQHGSQIHTLLAAGDHPLKAAGSRMALSPESVFVRMACRHPITEAGIGSSIERLGAVLDALERGDPRRGMLTDLGVQRRNDYATPLALVEQVIPAGAEQALPRGGKRLYGFDPNSHLPVLVVARDEKGNEVEYYRYDRLVYPVRLDDQDFDPDRVWGKAGGARAAAP